MVAIRCLTITSVLCAVSTVEGAGAALRGELVSRDVVKKRFQSEFEALLGHGSNHVRLQRLEDKMRPTFAALPKTTDGGISQETARYMLHRYFSRQHGWVIKGLKRQGARDETSLEVLKAKMPSVVFELLEEQMAGRTIGLRELAVLAATIEDLVYGESMDLMSRARTYLGDEGANATTEGFIALFSAPSTRRSIRNKESLRRHTDRLRRALHGWEDLALWAQDVRMTVTEVETAERNPFKSNAEIQGEQHLGRVAEAVTEGFGRIQDLECRALKGSLLDLSKRTDGRVLLSSFYTSFINKESKWFTESKQYLRHHGMLEEVDTWRPTVIISNYLQSTGNCIAASGFMSVCCINECENMMSSIEEQVSAPTASPERLAEIVSGLPSDTVAAPRVLHEDMVTRLREIAAFHGGAVPLHSRLFAQWMHHAYPNECAQPHTVNETADEPIATIATKSEMTRVIELAEAFNETEDDDMTLESYRNWFETNEEELLVKGALETQAKGRLTQMLLKFLRGSAMVGVVGSSLYVALGKMRSLKHVSGLPEFSKGGMFSDKQHFV